MTDACAPDQNTINAPLRINSSARIAIGLGGMFFFGACIVLLALYGKPDNGLHQTLMTGSLWIVTSIIGGFSAPAGFEAAGRIFGVKPT